MLSSSPASADPSAPLPPLPSAADMPSLDDIPIQYSIDQLHRLGEYYWHHPETVDCCLHIPQENRRLSKLPQFGLPQDGIFPSPPPEQLRRGSEPLSSDSSPLVKLHLHQFYLSTQSSLLRALFSGSSALGLHSGGNPVSAPRLDTAPIPQRQRQDSLALLHARMPRLLPSNADYPVLYLPLPDPSSFPHIVHYMYFGSPAFMHEALSRGLIRWEGVIKNIEYLGLWEAPQGGIRHWLQLWRLHQTSGSLSPSSTLMEESDEDSSGSDEESSDEWSGSEEWNLGGVIQSISEMRMVDPFAPDALPSTNPTFGMPASQGPLEVNPIAS